MASTQIPACDPSLLQPKELEVEYEVRDISGRDLVAFNTLKELMRAEADGLATVPTMVHAFVDEQVELTECKQIATDLSNLMRDAANNPNWGRADAIRSRLVHLLHRVDRFRQSRPENRQSERNLNDVRVLIEDDRKLRAYLTSKIGAYTPYVRASTGSVSRQLGSNVQERTSEPSQGMQSPYIQQSQPTPMPLQSSGQHNVDTHYQEFLSRGSFSQPPPGMSTSHQSLFPQPPQRIASEPTTNSRREPSSLRRLDNLNPDHIFTTERNTNPFPYSQNSSGEMRQPTAVQQRSGLVEGDARQRPASSIMCKWAAKFTGGTRDMSADEFVFRVEDMATSSNINFDDMCRSIHVLLSSRAEEWFWGFRRKQTQISWQIFRAAFLKKFATRDTDEEIMTMMSQRTQRTGERFDDFCRSVESMSFRMQNTLPEANMVALLKANSDPHLRSILNMHNIDSVDMLQEICTKYEELWIKQGVWRRGSRHIEEIGETSEPIQNSSTFVKSHMNQQICNANPSSATYQLDDHQVTILPVNPFGQHHSINALGNGSLNDFKCWNCDEQGHSYQDCEVATRNTFCYGCGAKNVYKPQCQRCALNTKRRGNSGPSYSGRLPASGPNTHLPQNKFQ